MIDEIVPAKLIGTLRKKGFNVARAPLATDDWIIAQRARRENRVLVTMDKDFITRTMLSSAGINIIFIQIQPCTEELVMDAFDRLLKDLSQGFKGLVILRKDGHTHTV